MSKDNLSRRDFLKVAAFSTVAGLEACKPTQGPEGKVPNNNDRLNICDTLRNDLFEKQHSLFVEVSAEYQPIKLVLDGKTAYARYESLLAKRGKILKADPNGKELRDLLRGATYEQVNELNLCCMVLLHQLADLKNIKTAWPEVIDEISKQGYKEIVLSHVEYPLTRSDKISKMSEAEKAENDKKDKRADDWTDASREAGDYPTNTSAKPKDRAKSLFEYLVKENLIKLR